jgi:hypothetical protein
MKHDFYALQAGGHWFEPSISHESRNKFRDFFILEKCILSVSFILKSEIDMISVLPPI